MNFRDKMRLPGMCKNSLSLGENWTNADKKKIADPRGARKEEEEEEEE